MRFLKDLSISGKIISVVMIIILLETAVAVISISFLNNDNRRLNTIVDSGAEKIKLAARINRNFVEIQRSEKNLLLSDTTEAIDMYTRNISESQNSLESRLSDLKVLLGTKEEALIREFHMNYQEFMRINARIQSLIFNRFNSSGATDSGGVRSFSVLQNSEAIALSQGKGRDAFERAFDSIRKLVEFTESDLEASKSSSNKSFKTELITITILAFSSLLIGILSALVVSRSIAGGMNSIVLVAEAIADGNLDSTINNIDSKNEIGALSASALKMQQALKKSRNESNDQDWLKTGLMRLNQVMLGETDLMGMSNNIITEMANYLDAKIGAFYLSQGMEDAPVLSLFSSYAYTRRKNISSAFKIGEGLVGQCAKEKKQILISNVPEDHIKMVSGLGESTPRFIAVSPCMYEERVTGVVEIGFLDQPSDLQLKYLAQAMATIAVNFETVQGRENLAKALAKAETLAEELESQQEELRVSNEELEAQTQSLETSEQKLKEQQEELEVINEELMEKNESLNQQKQENEKARKAIEEKAEELAIAGKYKSEFLANMSHELRTPLNSLLLLSSILMENKEGNLNGDQLESIQVVYKSGNDLLSLINEILDLSKIESGKMELQSEEVAIKDIAGNISSDFQHMMDDKGLGFSVTISEDIPQLIQTDGKRLEQVLKNLMSNAIKFTKKGRVSLDFHRPTTEVNLSRSGLNPINTIAISVTDTGIGISPEDQKIVFEAFQQAEGGTARQYGGTGLGLSISREIARLLGGEIQLVSEKGKGSVFTIYLPVQGVQGVQGVPPGIEASGSYQTEQKTPGAKSPGVIHTGKPNYVPAVKSIPDDRETLKENEKTILVIEDDLNFARLMLKLCHERGLKCLTTPLGEEGIELAEKYMPEAIILDIKLPGIDGWTVLETVKGNSKIRHIPVHIMSVDEPTLEAFQKGAIGYLKKPINKTDLDEAFHKLVEMFSKEVKNLLVVEDDENLRKSIIKLIGNGDVFADEAANGSETIEILKSKTFDCMILDLGLPDMTGFQLLDALEAEEDIIIPPVIVYTGRDLTREEDAKLREHAQSIIIKGVKSEERLLDEASLFLHRVVGNLPETKRTMITNLHDTDMMLKDKSVLIVDDDMRNVFALTKVLKGKGMRVLKAENGQMALEILKQSPDVDLVLMDIMMPVMDGYETIKRIREQEKFQKLPIIALTAKAMKEDRTRCISAGASDYLAKPVDVNRLRSMMRVWLYR